ncbi:MAG: hypothetical protein ABUL42_03570 [Terricaulis silvestris]
MRLWFLVGAFSLMAAPNAFALDTLTDPVADTNPVAHVDDSGAALKRKCGAAKREDAHDRQQQRDVAARTPPPRPRTADQQHADQTPDAQDVDRDDALQRRRNGRLEAIPDSLLLGGHGAL